MLNINSTSEKPPCTLMRAQPETRLLPACLGPLGVEESAQPSFLSAFLT